jgi:hypothetical protein
MPPPDIKPDFLVSLKSLSVYVLVAANMDKLLFADNNVPLLLNVLPSACVSLKKLRVVVFFWTNFFWVLLDVLAKLYKLAANLLP